MLLLCEKKLFEVTGNCCKCRFCDLESFNGNRTYVHRREEKRTVRIENAACFCCSLPLTDIRENDRQNSLCGLQSWQFKHIYLGSMPVPHSLSLTVHFSSLAPTVAFSDNTVNQIEELNWQIPTEHCHGSAYGSLLPLSPKYRVITSKTNKNLLWVKRWHRQLQSKEKRWQKFFNRIELFRKLQLQTLPYLTGLW